MRSTDEVYGSLAYDGAPLFRVCVCVSRVLLVLVLAIILANHFCRIAVENCADVNRTRRDARNTVIEFEIKLFYKQNRSVFD